MPKNQMERTTNNKKMKKFSVVGFDRYGTINYPIRGWLAVQHKCKHAPIIPPPEKLNIQLHYFTNTLKLNVFRYIKDIIKMYHDFCS